MTQLYGPNIDAASASDNETFLIADYPGGTEDGWVAKGNGTVGGDFGVILAGVIMGIITASKLWRPVAKQIVNGAQSSTATVQMQSAKGFYPGDVIDAWDVSAGSALFTGRTVVSVDKTSSPNVLVISSAAVWEVGDYIYVNDGSATPRGYLARSINTFQGMDSTGASVAVAQSAEFVRQGKVKQSVVDALIKHNALIVAGLNNPTENTSIVLK